MTNNQQEKRPRLNCQITAKDNGTNIEINLGGVTAATAALSAEVIGQYSRITSYMDYGSYRDFICAFIAAQDEVTDRIILAKLWGYCGGDTCIFTDLVAQPNYDEEYDFSTAFFEALVQEIIYQLHR